MDTQQKQYRPSIWEGARLLATLSAITLVSVITHNDAFTVAAALLIFGGIIAWNFLRYWRSMGWI